MTAPATTTVRVRNHEAEGWGGNGPLRVCVETVEIPDPCLTCGGPRGETRGLNQCYDGVYSHVNVWTNPCGHVDYYEMVLAAGRREWR